MRTGRTYVSEVSELNHDDARKQMIEDLEYVQNRIEFFNIFDEELKNWDGKKLNKRLKTNIKSMVDHLTISFNRDKSFTHEIKINVWSKNANNPICWFTFKGDDKFDYQAFVDKHEYWYSGIYVDLDKRTERIKNSREAVAKYNNKVRAFNKALLELRAAENDL